MIHNYSITSQSLLPSPLKKQDFTSSYESLNVCAYCGSADLTSYHVCGINYRMKIYFFVFK